MRVSTFSMHQSSLDAMLAQQARLSRTQNQLSTGYKLQTAADDPAAAVHVLELQRALSAAEQHRSNSVNATNRLQLEELTLSDATGVLQRLRELALQANSPVLDNDTRAMLSAEIRARAQELLAIANRQDVNGEYLFAGFASGTQPFQRNAAGSVQYLGDPGQREQAVAPGQKIADGHSGDYVFARVRETNGEFVTRFAAANTGTGIIDVGTMIDRAAWDGGNYTINFTAANSYEVRDNANALVTSGAYQADAAISFRGISVRIAGAPSAGDQFTVRPAAYEDIFTTVDRLLNLSSSNVANVADRAKMQNDLGSVAQQLTMGLDRLLMVRAETGARLSALDAADSAREAFGVENQRLLSQLRDVDYAEAVSRMNRELLALQAAQSSYTRLAQLSLFNYL